MTQPSTDPGRDRHDRERDGPVKVLYVAGAPRSGSTIIHRILGQVEGFTAGGEVSYLFDGSLGQERRCGCGLAVGDCPCWRTVTAQVFGHLDEAAVARLLRARALILRHRYLPRLVVARTRRSLEARSSEFLAVLGRVYKAIQAVTGCRVVIDSSKFILDAYVLGLVPEVDLYVVHLVRDVRAVAFSGQRHRERLDGTGRLLARVAPARAAILWSVANLLAQALLQRTGRYLLLRYEDFAADPRPAVRRILALLGEGVDTPLPLVGDRRVTLGLDHTLAGNPNRFDVGETEIRPDEEWRTGMSAWSRVVVTGLSWPLLLRYGYLGARPATDSLAP